MDEEIEQAIANLADDEGLVQELENILMMKMMSMPTLVLSLIQMNQIGMKPWHPSIALNGLKLFKRS